MSQSLREAAQGIPEKYLKQMSLKDLQAIEQDDVDAISLRGLQIIQAGKQDLGAGEFLDVGTSIGGAITGAAMGAAVSGPLAPAGAVIGGIIGGAVGAFGGEAAEDVIAGRDLNLGFGGGGAGKAAAESALWDTVFLGAGKIIRPVAARFGLDPSRLFNRVTGVDPGAAPKPAERVYQEFPENSQESMQQIQSILRSEGGSLTAFQTGRSPFVREFAEQIANIGFLSSDMVEKRIAQNTEIFQRGFQDMIQGIDPTLAKSSSDLGQAIVETVMTGEKLAKNYYGQGIEKLLQEAGSTQVSAVGVQKAISEFIENNKTLLELDLSEGTRSILSNRTAPLVRDSVIVNPLTSSPFKLTKTADLKALIRYQQRLTKEIEKKRPSLNNIDADEAAFRELGKAEVKIKEAIANTIEEISPRLAKQYRGLNRFYSTSMDSLFPEAVGNDMIRAANKEMYTSIGNLIAGNGDVGKIAKLMSSINSSFDIAKKTGLEFTGNVNTPERARALMRQSFIANRIADPATNALDVRRIEKLSDDLKNINVQQRYRTVLGEDYAKFKTFVDGVKASTARPEAGVLSLSIRGREVGAALQVASIGAAAGAGAITAGTLGAIAAPLAVFALPVVAAKVALNKAAASRLLMLDSAVKKNPGISPELVAAQVTKIFEELSDDDMEDIREGIF